MLRGGNGPRVAVIAGIHGDELEGLYVCHRLAAWLEQLAEAHPHALRGRVDLIPALNPLGIDTLERFVPVFDADLNRNFPGDAEGLLPQRIAAAAMAALAGAALVIDIHASNIFLREIPQVRINQEFASDAGAAGAADEPRSHLAARRGDGARSDHRPQPEQHAARRASSSRWASACASRPSFTEQLLIGILNVWRSLGVLAPDAGAAADRRTRR